MKEESEGLSKVIQKKKIFFGADFRE